MRADRQGILRRGWPSSPGGGWSGRVLGKCLCVAAVLAAWACASAIGTFPPDVLPSVPAVFGAFVGDLHTSAFWAAVSATLAAACIGLVAAIVVGVPLGLLTGSYAAAERSTRLLVDAGRSFPVIALLPVMLLLLGTTTTMKSWVVFLACLFPLFLQAQYGARSVAPTIAETVRSYRIPRLLRFRKVVLPSATPSIMTGLRLAATTSVLVSVAVEILTTLPGLGQHIISDETANSPAAAFSYILAAGLIGYAVSRLCQIAERHFLRWRPPPAR